MKIKATIQTEKVGSRCETEFEIEDDATDEEIEEVAFESIWDMAEWYWEKEED